MRKYAMLLALALSPSLLAETKTIDLAVSSSIKLVGVDIASATYKGKHALRVTHRAGEDGRSLAILPAIDFADGTIEYEFASDVKPNSPASYRAFAGLAFRVSPDGSKYECFYQRPLNARSPNQEQRNHTLEYISMPDFPWQRLRQETPSKYEVYADMAVTEWTKIKIEVKGDKARIYVNDARQPTMIVDDLKHGVSRGTLGLWVDVGTIAHFANLRLTQ